MSDEKKPINQIYVIQKRLAFIKGVAFNYTPYDWIEKFEEQYENTDAKTLETVLLVE